MQKISTSSLAKERKITPAKLFEDLQDLGYINRKGDSWDLTESGKSAGGEIQKSSKYGEYIVWPTDLKIEKNTQINHFSKKLINGL